MTNTRIYEIGDVDLYLLKSDIKALSTEPLLKLYSPVFDRIFLTLRKAKLQKQKLIKRIK